MLEPSEILLLGPGPSPVSHAVRCALAASPLGHLDPDFLQMMDRVQNGLRALFGTQNRFTLPISGTGSAGMETMLLNMLAPGDRIVVGVHGVFGARLAELARRLRADVVTVTADFGTALPIDALRAAIAAGPTKFVAVVHAETSTGVLQPLPDIAAAARQHGAMLLLDCVTSLGGVPIDVDTLGVDVAFGGSQKCLSVPPGLAPITFSDRALALARARTDKPTWYFDVGMLAGYWGTDRVYHHTAPTSLVAAMDAALRETVTEGADARHQRHRAAAAALYRGIEALGLTLLVDAPLRTPMLTSIRVPDGVDEKTVRQHLRNAHRIEIGGGLGPLAGKIWRIGLMGHGARLENVRRVVAALGGALATAGLEVDIAAALQGCDRTGPGI